MRFLFSFLAALSLVVLMPVPAHADYGVIQGTVESVGSALPFLLPAGDCVGNQGCGFVDIAEGVVVRLRPLFTSIAVLVIVIAGFRMIIGQEDEAVTKSRAIMSGTIAGLVMLWLIDPFIHAFYGSHGEVPQGAMDSGVAVLSTEVTGLINWGLTIVAALDVTMIIVSAIKSFGSSTGEEGIANMRKTIISVVLGLILLVLRLLLSEAFVMNSGSPAPILAAIVGIISFFLGFLALAALVIVIYAGLLYVLSAGKEEQATKAKGLLIRALIGAMVLFVSLALVNFVIL